jgi:glycosyltransferase involved in cell wall biosynthesis
MNIAIDVTSYLASRAGVGVCVGQLVRALLASPGEDRFKLCAVSARREAAATLCRSFPAVDGRICVRHLPLRLLSPLVDMSPWLKVETLFGDDADVFHASPFLVPAGKKTATVVTVFDLTPIRFPEFHLRSNLFTIRQLRRRLERADVVMVPSDSTGKDLEEFGLVPRQKVRVIPLAADACFRPVEQGNREVLAKLGVECEYVLNVGTLEPRKNLPRLFEAFRLLKDRHRIPHKLVVAGPRGWKDEEIFQSVRRLNLTDAVVFTGYIPDDTLNLFYSHATLLVYPSLYEGFGLPPLEAMAAGCPVAVSKTSSLPEVVGQAGVYFDPLEVEEIAQAIYRILDSPDFRANLIELGRARSREFSWEKTAAATLRIYKEALAFRGNR